MRGLRIAAGLSAAAPTIAACGGADATGAPVPNSVVSWATIFGIPIG
jgi:hypothetical protein